jgi:hypothetical protein
MLHRHVLDACLTTATLNADANVLFKPKPATPLAELIQAGTTLIEPSDDSMSLTETISANSMLKDAGGSIPHDRSMEEIVKLAADAVSGMLNITRNVVRPIILDQVEMLDAHLDEELTHGHRHEILPVFLEDAFSNTSIVALVEKYAETAVDAPPLSSAIFPAFDGAQLRELIKTGITRIDNDVDTLLADLPPEFLIELYQSKFRAQTIASKVNLSSQAAARIERAEAIMSFFIAKRFYEETPEGVTVSLPEFKEAAASHLAQAGRRVYRTIAQREAFIRQQRLILDMPHASNTEKPILVVGEVYNQYLKEGGKPEWVMGACLAGEKLPSPNTLNSESETFQRMYDRAERLHKSQNNAKRVSVMVSGIRKQLMAYIAAVDESDKSIIIDPKDVLRQRVEEVVSGIAVHANLSTYEYVRVVVCMVFFPHTQALRILSDIDAHALKNPSLSPREAATLATIDLVCEWAASQVDVTRNAR